MTTATSLAADPFDHPALLYRDSDEYLAGTVPFIQSGLAAGDPVLVAVPGANLELLREGMGADADRVRWRDMQVAGSNPGRIIPGVLLAFAAAHPDRRVRIIGEPIWAGRTQMEYPACAQHEALINAVFTGREAEILCPYDLSRLDQQAIDDAYRTHPVMATPESRWTSPRYGEPTSVAAGFNTPLPEPPDTAKTMAVNFAVLANGRRLVADHATRAGLAADRVEELTLAVNELTTNTVQHTAGTGTLAVWTEDRYLVCQVRDTGHISDPLAGRVPPPPNNVDGGYGLVVVNQLCDFVRIHTEPGATTIRVHVAIP